MTFWLVIDAVTACAALVLMALVVRGWAPHIRLSGPPARRAMVVGLLSAVAALMLRTIWWDFGRIVSGWLGFQPEVKRAVVWSAFNAATNLLTCNAMLGFLAVLYHAIPEPDRRGYSWVSAPWYPPRSRVRPTLPDEDLP